MKKKYLGILIIVGCISLLGGCGKKDQLVEQCIEKIESLGEITLEDEEVICDLEKIYTEMTDKQKDNLKNYVKLIKAREDLDELKRNIAAEPPYDKAIVLCQALKDSLINSKDFSLKLVEYNSTNTSGQDIQLYKINFSCKNLSNEKYIILLTSMRTDVYYEGDDDYIVWDSYFDETNIFYDEDHAKEELNIDIIVANLS